MNIIAASGSEATTPPVGALLPPRAESAPAPGTALKSHYDRCVGCGADQEAGLHLQLVAGQGLEVTGEFLVTADHQGAPGLAHGGMLVAAIDEAMGALNWLLMSPAVTGRLEADFRRPVPVGTTLYLAASITGVSGRKVYSVAEGRIGSPSGAQALTATAVFLKVDLEHFRQHGRADDVERAASLKTGQQLPWLEINP